MFERVAILGLGLMGASLGLALRGRGLARDIVGYDVAPDVLRRAYTRGAISAWRDTAAGTVLGCDLVVLATPVLAMRGLLADIDRQLAIEAVVTDIGSTKGSVVEWAAEALRTPGRFIGGHPMAGSERSGPEAAEARLFEGCAWCLTPTERSDPAALARLVSLVTALGARPVTLAADQHDVVVAIASHLPLVAAAALTRTAVECDTWTEAAALAANGFRDTTRVASGDPRMARDICLTNGRALVPLLDAYMRQLGGLREAIQNADSAAIEAVFASAKAARDGWLATRAQ
jgi:prephenate dehydrogenase